MGSEEKTNWNKDSFMMTWQPLDPAWIKPITKEKSIEKKTDVILLNFFQIKRIEILFPN